MCVSSRVCLGLRLASNTKLLTHYAKGTALCCDTLPAYEAASSGFVAAVNDLLFTVPLQYCTLLLTTRYLALGEGTPMFKQCEPFYFAA